MSALERNLRAAVLGGSVAECQLHGRERWFQHAIHEQQQSKHHAVSCADVNLQHKLKGWDASNSIHTCITAKLDRWLQAHVTWVLVS